MRYLIDKEKRPVYLQLYKQLRDDIISELYPYNSKLPSKRGLAEETGVSIITVEHAYQLLCDEGYAEARERSGYFAIFQKTDGFAAVSENPQATEILLPEAGEYPDFPLSLFSKTMRKVLSEHGELLFEKSPNEGRPELRRAISQYLARNRGIHADLSQIIIGSGSEYLYGLIIELLGRSRVFAIESPSYKKIEQVYRAAEVSYESLPLHNDGIHSRALAETKADILHTTPYRSYPSGVTASASKRHEYIRWAQEKNRFIIEDDFESEFSVSTKPMETLFSLSDRENVIYLNTFSKTISPSLRIGYMVLPKGLAKEFEDRLGFYSCTVPTFMQFVLAELINNGDFERHINRVRRKKRKALSEPSV
ncbi:MAG: PLP-dependent aminotransferase family protein [Firmicutes bacterium]|nr:PLP-dependent aminotransferase family protein [Clostridiales bacterium]MBQ9931780.1 PLP-dependent aminotransferase family protein [Bacillota bacterium]